MSEICIVTTCMGRLDQLRETLGSVVSQARCSCVVVDYSCPQACGEWVETNHPGVRVVRVPGRSHFCLSWARNAGVVAADAPWLCFLDADVGVDPSFSEAVIPLLRADHYYRADPILAGLSGALVVPLRDFVRIGGYDTIIQGWGWEENDLVERLRVFGSAEGRIPAGLFRSIPHPDALRVEHYRLKDLSVSVTSNMLYSRAKVDLIKVSGSAPRQDFLRELYDRACRAVAEAREGLGRDYSINFHHEILPDGSEVIGSLRYTVRHPEPRGDRPGPP